MKRAEKARAASFFALAVIASAVSYRAGGGMDRRAPPPAPESVASVAGADDPAPRALLHVRIAGANAAHRVTGRITLGDPSAPPRLAKLSSYGVPAAGSFREDPSGIDVTLTTSPDHAVGLDLLLDPPDVAVRWELSLDGAPWPQDRVFTGPFSLPARAARLGLVSAEARAEARSPFAPEIDPRADPGLFIAWEPRRAP